MLGFEEFQKLNEDKQKVLSGTFDEIVAKITNQSLIAMIRDEVRRFEDQQYASLVQQLIEWNQPDQEKQVEPTENGQPQLPNDDQASGKNENDGKSELGGKRQQRPETISAKNIKVNFRKPWLADETDIDEYLAQYRDALLGEIKQGKKVQL